MALRKHQNLKNYFINLSSIELKQKVGHLLSLHSHLPIFCNLVCSTLVHAKFTWFLLQINNISETWNGLVGERPRRSEMRPPHRLRNQRDADQGLDAHRGDDIHFVHVSWVVQYDAEFSLATYFFNAITFYVYRQTTKLGFRFLSVRRKKLIIDMQIRNWNRVEIVLIKL